MSDSTGTPPPPADSFSIEDFNVLIAHVEVLLALGKRLSVALAAQNCEEYLLSEAAMIFIKTLLSLQGFLRFIPASQFHAKDGDFVIDLSSASLMARQTLEDAISFFYLSQPALTTEQKKFRGLAWRYHGATQTFTCAKYMAELKPSLLAEAVPTDELDATQKLFLGRLKEPAFLPMLNAIEPSRRGKIKVGREAYALDKREIVNRRGIGTRAFDLPYKLFSNFVHTSAFSLSLMRRTTARHPGYSEEFITPARFVAGFAAEVIEAFLETFSETRKLVDDEERDIISTLRSLLRNF
jgi:hypothetical protein